MSLNKNQTKGDVKQKHKSQKRYTCIAKTGNEKFVKYRLNNLAKFTAFLDRKWPNWRWFNVFDNRTKLQIANFTKNSRPTRLAGEKFFDEWYPTQ
jgi:hypothetical protein